jgi:hypothetical protein
MYDVDEFAIYRPDADTREIVNIAEPGATVNAAGQAVVAIERAHIGTCTVPITDIRPRQIERKKTTRMMRVDLSNYERLEAANAMADAHQQMQHLMDELDTAKKLYMGQIKAQEVILHANAELLRVGFQTRNVALTICIDFDEGKVTEIRDDIGQGIKTRDLTPEEQQRTLPFTTPVKEEPERLPAAPEPQAPIAELGGMDEQTIADAITIIRETQRASATSLKRRLKVSDEQAIQILNILEERGIVGPPKGKAPRDILKMGEEGENDTPPDTDFEDDGPEDTNEDK